MLYDLHTHSNNSDGKLSRLELLKKANDLKFDYLCITDHDYITEEDTLKTYLLNTGKKSKTILLNGIEFTIDENKKMHLLGYGIKNIQLVKSALKKIEIENLMICKRLLEHLKDNYQISLDLEKYKNCRMTKGLIRTMLVENGYASSLDLAGDLYTGKKSKFYERTKGFPLEDTIKLIIESGGIPVLAHPSTLNLTDELLDKEVKHLKEIGLIGIEILNTSKTSLDQSKYYELIAKKYDLLTSCGSDYHNDNKAPFIGIRNNKSKKIIKKIME